MKHALTGSGILVTRPIGQSAELTRALTDAGGRVLQMPVIDIVARDPAEVVADANALPGPDIVIFVSRNAVSFGAAAVRQVASASTRIAAIGNATRSALSDAGLATHICPTDRFDSERLLEHAELQDVADKQILIVRGTNGRELLAQTLAQRGANVNYLAAYQRKTAVVDPQTVDKINGEWANGAIDVVIVMSVDSFRSLLKILPADCHDLLRKTRLVTPSKRVIQTAVESLPGIDAVLADSPQAASLVNAIIQ